MTSADDLSRAEARFEAAQQRNDYNRRDIQPDGELQMLRRSLTSDALSPAGRRNTIGRIAWLSRECGLRLAAE